jgi:hypothetical protein
MKKIPLTKGKFAIVDDDDFEFVSEHKWYCNSNNMAVYECRIDRTKIRFLMHRVIMDCPDGMEVDHINGDRLDNRKENLRIVTRHQNMLNRKVRSDSKTGYKGVEYKSDQARSRPYAAYIRIDNKKKTLGHYKTAEEAAKIYDEAALKYHGEYANLNFSIKPEE